jgi:hypothetical protein
MGILTLYGTKNKHKENYHVFSRNNVAFMEYFLPSIGKTQNNR